MAQFQSRNQMSTNKNNPQAQMLMLLSQVNNLENQLRQRSMPQNQTMGVDSSNLLNLMGQLTSLQGKLPTTNQRNAPNGKRFGGKPNRVPVTPLPNLGMNLAGLLTAMTGKTDMGFGRCVWVTGLPEDYQDADKLCNIFGNFGNVRRIKFTEKKPDGALIEMDDSRAAWKCAACMHTKKINGQEIKVTWLKENGDFAKIKDGDTKSKDVRQAKENWRFTSKTDGKFRKICMSRLRKLSPLVVVTNLPEGKSDELQKHIIEAGYTVKSVEGSKRPHEKEKTDKNAGYTMAIVELASIEEAIGAVANLHNTWPKKFGTKKNDFYGNARGLVFSFAGTKLDKSKA